MRNERAERRLIYGRFPAGFGPVIERRLRASAAGAPSTDARAIERVFDEACLFDEACVRSGSGKLDKRTAGLFSALYVVLDSLAPSAVASPADAAIAEFARRIRKRRSGLPGFPPRGSFRVRVLMRNEPAAADQDALSDLERAFADASGLRADRRGGGGELCVLLRAEGSAFLLYRQSSAEPCPSPFGQPLAGELPAHTARLLVECTLPRDDDLFLDPFAGSGAIPFQRALAAPFKLVFAQDASESSYALLRERLSDKALAPYKKRIFPKLRDARDLVGFEECSVTALVADPPWGRYEGGVGAGEAMNALVAFLASARRVLARDARMVLLLERGIANALVGSPVIRPYRLEERLDVLISGMKASVLVMK